MQIPGPNLGRAQGLGFKVVGLAMKTLVFFT